MRWQATVCLSAVLLFSGACRSGPPPDEAANPTGEDTPAPTDKLSTPTFADFAERVDLYMKERARAEDAVPPLKETSDPAKVSGREKALADAIRTVRRGAEQGEVFSDAAAEEFRRIVKKDFDERSKVDQTAVLKEVPMSVPPRVNDDYPTTMPLATFPPSLLLNLPTLPDVLEYRFLGRHLILRDMKANLIVDYVPDCVPAGPAAAAAR
jgi:hypothetical protein